MRDASDCFGHVYEQGKGSFPMIQLVPWQHGLLGARIPLGAVLLWYQANHEASVLLSKISFVRTT